MDKKIVNENEYISMLNSRLKKHPSYKEGMEIFGVPDGRSGSNLTGYNWRGPSLTPGLVSEIVHEVEKEYEYRPKKE